MGKVIGIATRPEKRAPMETHEAASVTFDHGVGEDSRGLFRNHRQITVMSIEAWNAACEELGVDADWTTRRANLLVEGIDLKNSQGKFMLIGDFQVEITGELEPCNRMDEQVPGLTNALKPDWRGGVTCRLLSEGEVKLGDEVMLPH